MITIKEISNQVGYNNWIAFSKAFKNKFGVSQKISKLTKVKAKQEMNREIPDRKKSCISSPSFCLINSFTYAKSALS